MRGACGVGLAGDLLWWYGHEVKTGAKGGGRMGGRGANNLAA